MADKKEVAYILGIVSIVMAFFQPLAGIIFGIIGLVQNRQERSRKARNMNIIGIAIGVIVFIALIYLNVYLSGLSSEVFPTY